VPHLEISDLIGAWDPITGERASINKGEVLARLREAGYRRAARIVERMPAFGECLDPEAVDRLFVRVHTELQRLGEELHMAQRFAELLAPVLAAARSAGSGPLRIVDIGCGLGYVTRTFAASAELGEDVELIGVDFNPALVAEATRLAEKERLKCRFVCGDAFALTEPATVYISTGVLHHFPAEALAGFFQAQDRPGTVAFVHYDIAATRLAPCPIWDQRLSVRSSVWSRSRVGTTRLAATTAMPARRAVAGRTRARFASARACRRPRAARARCHTALCGGACRHRVRTFRTGRPAHGFSRRSAGSLPIAGSDLRPDQHQRGSSSVGTCERPLRLQPGAARQSDH
jgi:SAM-dependent methyltransferase